MATWDTLAVDNTGFRTVLGSDRDGFASERYIPVAVTGIGSVRNQNGISVYSSVNPGLNSRLIGRDVDHGTVADSERYGYHYETENGCFHHETSFDRIARDTPRISGLSAGFNCLRLRGLWMKIWCKEYEISVRHVDLYDKGGFRNDRSGNTVGDRRVEPRGTPGVERVGVVEERMLSKSLSSDHSYWIRHCAISKYLVKIKRSPSIEWGRSGA